MRLVCASDIHGSSIAFSYIGAMARENRADAILLAGDICCNQITRRFIRLLPELAECARCPIICTPGNHDFWKPKKEFADYQYFGDGTDKNRREHWKMVKTKFPVVCLVEGTYEFNGIKIYGSPYTNRHGDWNWMRDVQDMKFEIPSDTGILLTHSPPFGYGDNPDGDRIGSEELAMAVARTPSIKLHAFGHAHCGGWEGYLNRTLLRNVAMADENLNVNYNGLAIIDM
jgi:Icc-related predicted phosphoesterase